MPGNNLPRAARPVPLLHGQNITGIERIEKEIGALLVSTLAVFGFRNPGREMRRFDHAPTVPRRRRWSGRSTLLLSCDLVPKEGAEFLSALGGTAKICDTARGAWRKATNMHMRTVLWMLAALLAAGRAEAAVGILDEAKLGLIDHDVAIGGDHREPGVDVNGELLFVSPPFLSAIFAPRPHFGLEINSDGKNSYAYGGLTWTANLTDRVFADLGLGGAIHDGPNESSPATRDHKGLGTRLLFHESVELGYRLTPAWNVAAYLDHVSNANIGSHNPGITNLGARVGYSF